MRRAVEKLAAGQWSRDDAVASVTLDFDDRYRRRIRLTDDAGAPFLLDLADATRLDDGDGLRIEGGGIIAVRAADEPVADARGDTPAQTARIAWHLGNRHTPIQVLPDGRVRIRRDHVLVAMLRGIGATVTERDGPFTPEPGAYESPGGHGHHDHDHDHADDHDHDHDHGHSHSHDHPHDR
ncbi:MAG: urease accessory protein UreE [Alphaproteobacteria bacterium]